jgi:hypothetical protein
MRRPERETCLHRTSIMPITLAPTALLALTLTAVSGSAMAQINASSAPTPSTLAPDAAEANGDFWRLVFSPYTYHFGADPEHEAVYAIGLERQRSDKWLWGATYFSNSFGQPSGYLYFGQHYPDLFSVDKLFAQWTVGLLYGYKYPYEDKVPFNHNGFSPGAVLSLGWQFTREFSMSANLLGSAGLMLQMSIDFR